MPFLTYMSISGRWPKVLQGRQWPRTLELFSKLGTPCSSRNTRISRWICPAKSSSPVALWQICDAYCSRVRYQKNISLDVLVKTLEQQRCVTWCVGKTSKKNISSDVLAEKWCVFCFFTFLSKKHSQRCGITPIGNVDFPPLGALHEQWSVRLRPPVKVEVLF